MSDDLTALSRRWFEEVWNRRRVATIDELLAEDVKVYGLSDDGQPAVGREVFRRFFDMFVGAFPDLRVTVDEVLVDGDRSAVRLSFTGRHSGANLDIAPTGQAFHSTGLILLHWKDGQVVEAWNEFDAAGMMRQLVGGGSTLRA